MFKNLDKNGNEKARPGTPMRIIICRPPDGRAALVALYPSYSSGIGTGLGTGSGDFGALRALVAECEGGRAWASEGAPVEVLRSRVGTWLASAVGSMKKKFSGLWNCWRNSPGTRGGGGGIAYGRLCR